MKKNLSKTQMLLLGATLASLSVGIVSYGPTIINPHAVTISADVKASSGKWGEANWVLANDGELIFFGGNIGHPSQSLPEVLREANIDPAAVKSIEFTTKTSANNISRAFVDLPELQKVLKLGNLNYSGSADSMFLSATNLEEIDLAGFDTSKISSMEYMFFGIKASTLDVSKFDTSNVTNMRGMFDGASNLTSLDLSNFDTSKVTDMNYMFLGAEKLEHLDINNFNTASVRSMESMFSRMKALEKLDLSSFTISENTDSQAMFSQTNNLKNLKLGLASQLNSDMNLANVPVTNGYTGKWQNVGSGTLDNPTGDYIWTSSEFMTNFDAATMADTYVWQNMSGSEMELGEVTDYSNDKPLSDFIPTATTPLNPYRYNVVLNNDYQFYSKLENGQLDTDNIISLGNLTGKTLYNKETVPVTYTSGDKKGQTTNFVNVSLEGDNWYWVDEHALNLDLAATYPSVNSSGIKLPDGMFLGSIITYGSNPEVSNSQMVSNAYNSQGKIIYESKAKIEDFAAESDPEKALAAFNKEIDRAAESWNAAINPKEPTIIKSSESTEPVTLVISPNPEGDGSATSSGNTGIESTLVNWALDSEAPDYDVNLLFITIRHELGQSLGLDHTSGGQYYGMPDGYRINIDDDVMNAILSHTTGGYPWTQKTITQESVDTVHLILKNQNFANPQH
ncbi:BspA family leucine-rich repeat surface protein [Lactococcus lactis]|uniref:BspA family leucine-rich repeat surface protein n=1 Tax=Lactococcus lactis TaxID=1358 RepID=A0A6M0M5R7_9LACT|nr:BspA family leucine-rich repeat surface protein [Lactococcus lactis]NEX49151.1 BspA family leucine-rich repeat surface protein [Lactococcus lactis]NEX54691.1 BspA family leucine-rich repeat surface protein [Lactococcus lactis]